MNHEVQTSKLESSLRLSEELWEIRWSESFPFVFQDLQIRCEYSNMDEVLGFFRDHYARLHQLHAGPQPFLAEESSKQKIKYHKIASEAFVFRNAQGVVIGAFLLSVQDWCTCYLRTVSILEEYQGTGLFGFFLGRLIKILEQSKLQFIEAELAPGNLGQVHLLNKLGFNVVGTTNSTRHGNMIRFCKFLDAKHLQFFLRHYSAGVRSQNVNPKDVIV